MRPAGSSTTAPSAASASISARSSATPPASVSLSTSRRPSARGGLRRPQHDQRRRSAVPDDRLRAALDRQRLAFRGENREGAVVGVRQRGAIVAAKHRRQAVGRFELLDVAVAEQREQRQVDVERLRVARHEDAKRKAVEQRQGVAQHRHGGRIAGRIGASSGSSSGASPAASETSGERSCISAGGSGTTGGASWREAGARPTRARAISRNASRSALLSSTLPSPESPASGGLAASKAPGRIGTIFEGASGAAWPWRRT